MTDDEKELKDQRVVTMMSPSELEAIDDWMFKNRIRSRGEAIRRLCQMALTTDERSDQIVNALFEHKESLLKTVDGFTELLSTDREDIESDVVNLFGDSLLEIVEEYGILSALVSAAFVPAKQMKLSENIEEALAALGNAKKAASIIVDKSSAKRPDDKPSHPGKKVEE